MKNNVYIYCLKCPEGNIRYIGKTINLKRRLAGHIYEAKKHRGDRYVLNWIYSLLEKGKKPSIHLIEECDKNNWQEKERYWISFHRKVISNLCNSCDGGLGGAGIRNYSEEELKRRAKQMSEQFSKYNDTVKEVIWTMIKLNASCKDINIYYPEFSQQMYSGVKSGKQWNYITGLPKSIGKPKRKGYTRSNEGLYYIRIKEGNTSKVIFSSRNEKEVIDYIKKSLLKVDRCVAWYRDILMLT